MSQFAVGSTINGRYRLLRQRGELAAYTLFDVEYVMKPAARRLVMLAPTPGAGQTGASLALRDAIMWEMNEKRVSWIDLDCTGQPVVYYVIGELTEQEIADLQSGKLKLGGS